MKTHSFFTKVSILPLIKSRNKIIPFGNQCYVDNEIVWEDLPIVGLIDCEEVIKKEGSQILYSLAFSINLKCEGLINPSEKYILRLETASGESKIAGTPNNQSMEIRIENNFPGNAGSEIAKKVIISMTDTTGLMRIMA